MVAVDPVGTPAAGVRDKPLIKGAIADKDVQLEGGIKGFLRCPVFDKLNSRKQPEAADIAHNGMPVKRLQLFQQICSHTGASTDEVVIPDIVQNGGGDGAGQRILAVGMPVHKRPVSLENGRPDLLLRYDTVNRRVSACQAFGHI